MYKNKQVGSASCVRTSVRIDIINNISKELRRVQRTRENYNEYSLVFVFPQTGSSVEQVTLVFGGEL